MDYTQVMVQLKQFRDERGWRRYHTLPELARAVSVEAAEINQCFLWSTDGQAPQDLDVAELRMEIADTLTYLYYMCDLLAVDPNDLVMAKLAKNQQRHWKFDHKAGDES